MQDDALLEQRDPAEPSAPRAPVAAHAPRVSTLLICDLADSTALVERLGDGPASDLMRRHDRVARDLMQRHGGREIDKTDGFLLLFGRPIEAVAFALAYQRALHELGRDTGQTLRARVGIHVGEIVLWENSAAEVAAGAKPVDVEGLAKPVVARLMALALPGQTVLSGVAFSLAQRAERELMAAMPVRWLTHGRYRFKGVAAPMLVHEVGESGFAPLHAPPSGAKAQRVLPLWRKPIVLALESIALLVAIAAPFALSLRAPPAIAFGERDWIVMGELRNLTGEPMLDASIETAFRISLEQSHYVNVLSDLKLRDALERMQRPPQTRIDREVASEIALREGARAVILPTIAEIGGRVRVSAEVIDPTTQTTVYAESADGVGAPSALESIDAVTHELRAKLGEALAAIEQDSAPLPKVTTHSLPALRHYALGQRAYIQSDLGRARENYLRALELDPDFALASIGLARVYHSAGDKAQARLHAQAASRLATRLTHRDALYIDAFAKGFGPPQAAVDAWNVLAEMYPDFHVASYNAAKWTWEYTGEYDAGITALVRAQVAESPIRAEAFYLQGSLQLTLDRFDAASRSFEQSKALGEVGLNHWLAALHMARREYPEAEAIIGNSVSYGLKDGDPAKHAAATSLLLDRGRLAQAATRADEAWDGRERLPPAIALAFASMRVAIAAYAEGPQQAEMHAAGIGERAALLLGEAEDVVSADAATEVLVTAYLLALHERGPAADALALRVDGYATQFPAARALRRLLLAERERRAGRLDAARDALARGSVPELYLEHLTRLRIERDAGRLDAALAEADWMVAHRGRALGDYLGRYSLRAASIVESNLAALVRAELLQARGRQADAERARAQFLAQWPDAAQVPGLGPRLAALAGPRRD